MGSLNNAGNSRSENYKKLKNLKALANYFGPGWDHNLYDVLREFDLDPQIVNMLSKVRFEVFLAQADSSLM